MGCSIDAKNTVYQTPLHMAARNNDLRIIQLLVRNGHPINVLDAEHETPLQYIIETGSVEAFELLMKRNPIVNMHNVYKESPLHTAARVGELKFIKRLLKYGACSFETPTYMDIAAKFKHFHIVKYLGEQECPFSPDILSLPHVAQWILPF